MREEPPANKRTLNLSVGLRFPIRSRRSFLDISKGKPYMEPETSTINIYSLGGIRLRLTLLGGWNITRKKFSFSPSNRSNPDWTLPPASWYFRIKSRFPPLLPEGSKWWKSGFYSEIPACRWQ